MAAQPAPKVWAAGSMAASELMSSDGLMLSVMLGEDDIEESVSVAAVSESPPQAARPSDRVSARVASPVVRRMVVRFI